MLHEQYRPKSWNEVVGQTKCVERIEAIRARGLAGKAYWIAGQSGTGKTTIARLLAAEIADEWSIDELDASDATVSRLKDLEQSLQLRGLGSKAGRVVIINEAHGLRKDAIRQLLVLLERIPRHVAWIFTTTNEGEDMLFEDCDDSSPLLSRCIPLRLARRDLAKVFAERAKWIAETEGLGGNRPLAQYERLAKDCKNNLRAMISAIEGGQFQESDSQRSG